MGEPDARFAMATRPGLSFAFVNYSSKSKRCSKCAAGDHTFEQARAEWNSRPRPVSVVWKTKECFKANGSPGVDYNDCAANATLPKKKETDDDEGAKKREKTKSITQVIKEMIQTFGGEQGEKCCGKRKNEEDEESKGPTLPNYAVFDLHPNGSKLVKTARHMKTGKTYTVDQFLDFLRNHTGPEGKDSLQRCHREQATPPVIQ
eukprot:gnl/MRDRNA2_/MRDRNA2_30070_c0_seq2.p1 gnl/MRDRNA2_/MRDRNA2_30070_c0~~gnl/MRDRNA2_/MRDRNA2_30070_c0_seq2.p1  ORF type:complete len:204 (+),score=37.73 gnl/MRDRNA2_/MRDRNA2_30070_c0_seq2:261-872(+)